jgi:hypothetical protein
MLEVITKKMAFATDSVGQITHILSGSRQVRPKMITRVLTWLEKLCR